MKPITKPEAERGRVGADAATRPNDPPMSPGDEAPRGTPGTGENVCRRCGGTGSVNGEVCPDCEGRGTVVAGIGGA